MKVLFYDGSLYGENFPYGAYERAVSTDYRGFAYSVDASDGYSKCKKNLDLFMNSRPNAYVLTNSLVVLDNTYCWNEETNSCDLYIFVPSKNEFVSANDFTDKKIKKAHNLEYMYRSGVFGLEDEND